VALERDLSVVGEKLKTIYEDVLKNYGEKVE
jgi:hypothetical protein